jgi:competence protein ComEA
MKFLAFLFLLVSFMFAKVDINTASVDQLTKVKGIGPAKAKAIIEYRTKNGSFKSVEELSKVKGFGEKAINAMKNDLEVMSSMTNAPGKK